MDKWPRSAVYSGAVNDRDHGPLIRIAAGFCTTCTLLFFMARLLARWPWPKLFLKDDSAALGATLVSIIQASVTVAATRAGLGKIPQDVAPQAVLKVYRMVYASNILYVVTIYASKYSVALFFLRIAGSHSRSRGAIGLTATCGVLSVVSFLTIAVENNASQLWLLGAPNKGTMLARWIVVEVLSSLVDITLVVFPMFLVWGLQMRQATKVKVVGAFALRLPLIALAILRLISVAKSVDGNAVLFKYATTEVFTQVEMCYTLICGTIPCLGVFMQAARSGMLSGGIVGLEEATAGRIRRHHSRVGTKHSTTGDYSIELTKRNHGKTATNDFSGNQRLSTDSGGSERRFVVQETDDIQPAHNLGRSSAKMGASGKTLGSCVHQLHSQSPSLPVAQQFR